MRRVHAAFLALAALASVAPHPARGSGPSASDDAAMLSTLPARLAGLRRQGPPGPAPGPEGGAVLAFARQNVTAAVTLSGRTALPVPDGPTSASARGALAEATGDASLRMLEEATRRARAGSGRRPTELRWRSFVVHDGSSTDLLCNRAALPASRGLVTEVVCVSGVAGRMMTVGITITHDRRGGEEAIRLACRFAAAARAALRDAVRLERA